MTPNELSTDVHPEPGQILNLGDLIDQEINKHADSLNELLTAEERIGIELTRLTAEHRRRRQKLLKAITTMRDLEEPPTAIERKSKKKLAKSWRPSDKIIERVHRAFADADAPLTIPDAAKLTGHSIETIRKSVDALRGDERLRFIGADVKRPGKPKLYAPMPTEPQKIQAVA